MDALGVTLVLDPVPLKTVEQPAFAGRHVHGLLAASEQHARVGDDRFDVVIAAAVGPLRARFKGTLRITEARPPEACIMVFEGQAGAVGFGKGTSTVELTDTPKGTQLAYRAQAHVGGKLAQVGSRLLDNVAKKMSDDFFAALRRQLATSTPVPTSAETADRKETLAPRLRWWLIAATAGVSLAVLAWALLAN